MINKDNWKDNRGLLVSLLIGLENEHETVSAVTGFIPVGTGNDGFVAVVNYLYDRHQLDEYQAMHWEEEYRDSKGLHQRLEMQLMD